MFTERKMFDIKQPFFIGEEIIFRVNKGELPEEVIENGRIIGVVIGYKTDLTDYIVFRYGFWNDQDVYEYRFFEIPRETWNRIEELGEDDIIEETEEDDSYE